jgi:4-hydroxy-2-oxoheptanedioate aldolase
MSTGAAAGGGDGKMPAIDAVTFRARAAAGHAALNGWCSIPEPTVTEIMALQPWDIVTVDLQHGLLDFQRALDLIRTIQGHGKPALARIPALEENWLIMKLLDAGANGLICPNISTPEDAARFIAACTYPPAGNRSYGPTRAVLLDVNYAKTADRRIIKAVQIEDDRSVAAVNEIAAVAGLDMLYVGPADLSLAYGLTPRLDPEYPEVFTAYEAVIEACRACGLVAGIHCLTPSYAARMYNMGFRFMSIANDVRLLARVVAETVMETAAAIEEVRSARPMP